MVQPPNSLSWASSSKCLLWDARSWFAELLNSVSEHHGPKSLHSSTSFPQNQDNTPGILQIERSIFEAHGVWAMARGSEKPWRKLVTFSSKQALTAWAGNFAQADLRQQNKGWESKELLSSHALSTLCTAQGRWEMPVWRNDPITKHINKWEKFRFSGATLFFDTLCFPGLTFLFFSCIHTGLIEIKAFKMKFLNIFNYSWGYQSWLLLGGAQPESIHMKICTK